MTLPQILHQVWLGGPMPERLRRYTRTWLRHHPCWDYRLWRERDIEPLLRNRAAYDAASSWSEKSDVARYEILLRYGGIYADTDFECLRSLDELLNGVNAFAGTPDGCHVASNILGAVPGHPFLAACVEYLPARTARLRGASPAHRTGPGLTTDIYHRLRRPGAPPPLTVFPRTCFHPYHYSEPHRRRERFPDAYAVHHWEGSWVRSWAPGSG
ncbi:glycosyltransferase [Streptomyces gamaensis]|uniref:Glycosyltransferase n=1 Tax=Streptomyces gamaensis TaxID=1763542 RepID=A0ABW0Z264_9ACTN